MCDLESTSTEHAPPQCFFPVEKEIGRNLRQNLITVPSCENHNSKKSKDDEYFRAVVLMMASQHSDAAEHLFLGKMLRAVKRKPHAYSSFFADSVELSGGTTRALQFDRPRFDRCVDQMARALFFHKFKVPWKLNIAVISPNFFSGVAAGSVIPHSATMAAADVSMQFLASEPAQGDNPEVFRFRLKYCEDDQTLAIAAIFYEALEIFAYSSKDLDENSV